MEKTEEKPKGIKDPAHKAHTVAAFIILLLTVSAIGAGAWYYLSTQDTDSYQSILKFKKKTSTATPTVTTTDETANWKTYEGKYFSFKYPDGYSVSDITQSSISTEGPWYLRPDFAFGYYKLNSSGKEFSVVGQKTNDKDRISGGIGTQNKFREQINLGTREAYIYTVGINSDRVVIALIDNNSAYLIHGSSVDESLAKQIIGTVIINANL